VADLMKQEQNSESRNNKQASFGGRSPFLSLEQIHAKDSILNKSAQPKQVYSSVTKKMVEEKRCSSEAKNFNTDAFP
jgi:hypothetical protein